MRRSIKRPYYRSLSDLLYREAAIRSSTGQPDRVRGKDYALLGVRAERGQELSLETWVEVNLRLVNDDEAWLADQRISQDNNELRDTRAKLLKLEGRAVCPK